jgi:hypothetical protein
MLKQLFKKVQKITISIEILYFMFSLYYSTNLHVFIFQKHISNANKIVFKFLHSEYKKNLGRGGIRYGNMVIQNTIKNTPEDDLDTFCIIISHLTSKYRPEFFGTLKIAGPVKSGL